MLRDSAATQGELPKIMAAYNAGLLPVTRWNTQVNDQGDPLLYMESIPYWETRGYVATVMRNYWMYERQAKAPSASRDGAGRERLADVSRRRARTRRPRLPAARTRTDDGDRREPRSSGRSTSRC